MLTQQDIEAELSYAYLHAVASKAGFSCEYRNRHLDGAGIDATITEDGRELDKDSTYTSFPLDVQLKATYQDLPEQDGRFSYALNVKQYDKLRSERRLGSIILILLRLPQNMAEWLHVSEEALVAKRCAYWVSLRGAPASDNKDTQTVYVPRDNLLSPTSLTNLMARVSREEVISHAV